MVLQSFWFVSLPVGETNAESLYESVKTPLELSKHAVVNRINIPDLLVGTLDSLITLSDEVVKINSQIDNISKKVERQYVDVITNSKNLSADNVSPSVTQELLKVKDRSIELYLRDFSWDFARYPINRSLSAIVVEIQSTAARVDEELKRLSLIYAEKNVMYSSLLRRKAINLSTSDFEDILTPSQVSEIEIFSSEALVTLVVVIPKVLEGEYLKIYSELGSDIAFYGACNGNVGSTSGRSKEKGSPVVPGSSFKIKEDGENVMYTITMLRGHTESGYYNNDDIFINGKEINYIEDMKRIFKEKRFTLRDFHYNINKAGSLDIEIEKAYHLLQESSHQLLNWCKVYYSDIMVGLFHLKIIELYVESVLRYSLPVNLVALLIEPNMRREGVVKSNLVSLVSKIRPDLVSTRFLVLDDEEEEDDSTLPFVYNQFKATL